MPFAKRIIKPTKLYRKHDILFENPRQFDPGIISSDCMVSALKQLSCLVKQADEIFAEISQECQTIVYRTQRLTNRVKVVDSRVRQLNARAVQVPVGELSCFSKLTDHYKTDHGYDCYMFCPATRPDCISDLYDAADPSPLTTIRKCNIYRTDGKTGSKIFSMPPVLLDENFEDPEPDSKQPVHVDNFKREKRSIRAARPRPRSLSALSELDTYAKRESNNLPTPEERIREISRSQPIRLVPIDVSGSGFDRMCEFRASSRSIGRERSLDGLLDGSLDRQSLRARKKHRRRTVSGIPGSVPDELDGSQYFRVSFSELRMRSASRERWERPRSAALEHYAPKGEMSRRKSRDREKKRDKSNDSDEEASLTRSCSLRRSLRSLFRGRRTKSTDLWAEGRHKEPGPPIIDLNRPVRRSRSLPRSLKSSSRNSNSSLPHSRAASTEGRLDSMEDDDSLFGSIGHVSGKPPEVPSGDRKIRLPRSRSHRSSLHATSTFGNTGARPKSLDLDHTASRSIPASTPVTPSHPGLHRGPSRPSGQVKVNVPCPEHPWAKPFANVYLRQNSNGKLKEERQSSSGHWSGSSNSARQSLESEFAKSTSAEYRSMTSLDKDSALSLNIHSPPPSENRYLDDNYSGESTLTSNRSTVIGDSDTLKGHSLQSNLNRDKSVRKKKMKDKLDANFTKMSSEKWLQSLKLKQGNGISPPGKFLHSTPQTSEESLHYNRGIILTLENLQEHDHTHVPYTKQISLRNDDESSVYSVDQEGFYTSMHRDSGVAKSPKDARLDQVDSSISSSSTSESDITKARIGTKKGKKEKQNGSLLTKLSGLKKGGKKGKRSFPPMPPRRMSTVLEKNNTDNTNEFPPPPKEVELQKYIGREIAETKPEKLLNIQDGMKPGALDISFVLSQSELLRKTSDELLQGQCLDASYSESDTEAIYARLKLKTNISSAAYPSLCSVTPVASDEEDAEILDFSSAWRNSNRSEFQTSVSVPERLRNSAEGEDLKRQISRGTPEGDTSQSSVDDSVLPDKKESENAGAMDGFSTWPRSPAGAKSSAAKLNSILKRNGKHSGAKPPRTLNFAPAVSLYDAAGNKTMDSNATILEAETPDDADPRGYISPQNTFQGPHGGSGNDSKGTTLHAANMYQSRESVQSATSIPSTSSDEPKEIPDKYQPKITITPRVRARENSANETINNKDAAISVMKADSSRVNHTPEESIPATVKMRNSDSSKFHYACSNIVKSKDGKDSGRPNSVHYASSPISSTTSTWPRRKSAPSESSSGSDRETSGSSGLSNADILINMFSKSNSKAVDQVSSPITEVCSPAEVCSDSVDRAVNCSIGVHHTEPQPASARLIISSPVSVKAQYVPNPHKRSLCSPVTPNDMLKFWNYNNSDSWYNTLPRKKSLSPSRPQERDPDEIVPETVEPHVNVMPSSSSVFEFSGLEPVSESKPLSEPLFPSLSAMKHSISFPVPTKLKTGPGSSWYETVQTKNKAERNSQKIGLNSRQTSISSNDQSGLECPIRRRDSNASSLSTNSSESGKRLTVFASIHKSSLSSLPRSEYSTSSSSSRSSDPSENNPIYGTVLGANYSAAKVARSSSISSNEQQPNQNSSFTIKPFPNETVNKPSFSSFAKQSHTASNEPTTKTLCVESDPSTNVISQLLESSEVNQLKDESCKSDDKVCPQAKPTAEVKKYQIAVKPKIVCIDSDMVLPNGVATTSIYQKPVSIQNAVSVQSVKISEDDASKNDNKAISSEVTEADASNNTITPATPLAASTFKPKTVGPIGKPTLNKQNDTLSSSNRNNVSASTTVASSNTTTTTPVKTSSGSTTSSAPAPPRFILPAVRPWPGMKKKQSQDSEVNHPVPDVVPRNDQKSTDSSGKPPLSPVKESEKTASPPEQTYDTLPKTKSKKKSKTKGKKNGPALSKSTTNLNSTSNKPASSAQNESERSRRTSLADSVSNLSNMTFTSSVLSLAKSTDSLSSNASFHAEKVRMAKLSFLSSGSEMSASRTSLNDRFGKHTLGQRSLSKTSLNISQTSLSSGGLAKGNQSPAVQGKFINQIINQLHKKSSDSLTSQPSTPSSGLGSSIPNSPISGPNTPSSNKDLLSSFQRADMSEKTSSTTSGKPHVAVNAAKSGPENGHYHEHPSFLRRQKASLRPISEMKRRSCVT